MIGVEDRMTIDAPAKATVTVNGSDIDWGSRPLNKTRAIKGILPKAQIPNGGSAAA